MKRSDRTETEEERVRREAELDAWCNQEDVCGPGAPIYIAQMRPDLLPPDERPEQWWRDREEAGEAIRKLWKPWAAQ
jgi:hypothetical protein